MADMISISIIVNCLGPLCGACAKDLPQAPWWLTRFNVYVNEQFCPRLTEHGAGATSELPLSICP